MATISDYIKTIFFVLLFLQFAPPLFYSVKKQYQNIVEPKTKVAYITIKGMILQSAFYAKTLRSYFKDRNIKGIVLHIESPGGAAGASEALALELDTLKKEHPKPVIVLSENICTSGAYYIAACADLIFVLPSTLVGSIGTCIPYQFKLKDFIEQFHIHYNVIKAGEYKVATDPFVNTTPEYNALLQSLANDSYKSFIDHVLSHRHNLTRDSSSIWANGKIFTGKQAESLGLVDRIGSLSHIITAMKELALIEGDIQWVKPEKSSNFWSLLTGSHDEIGNKPYSLANILHGIASILQHKTQEQEIIYF